MWRSGSQGRENPNLQSPNLKFVSIAHVGRPSRPLPCDSTGHWRSTPIASHSMIVRSHWIVLCLSEMKTSGISCFSRAVGSIWIPEVGDLWNVSVRLAYGEHSHYYQQEYFIFGHHNNLAVLCLLQNVCRWSQGGCRKGYRGTDDRLPHSNHLRVDGPFHFCVVNGTQWLENNS